MFSLIYLLPFHQIPHLDRIAPLGDREEKQVLLFSHGKRHGCLGLGDLEFLVNSEIWNIVVTQTAGLQWSVS